MEYPVQRFILDDLKVSVSAFAKKVGIPQSRFSSWKTRNFKISELPLSLMDMFIAESGLSYTDVRTKLLDYELEYDNDFKIIENTMLADNDFYESGQQFGNKLHRAQGGRFLFLNLFRVRPLEKENIDAFLNMYINLCSKLDTKAFVPLANASESENWKEKIQIFLLGAQQQTFR